MIPKQYPTLIGVDLGGTKVSAGKVIGNKITARSTLPISAAGPAEVVMEEVISAIEQVFSPEIKGIGVGVPSVVDVDQGVVYDVQNIPSWQEVPLKSRLQDQFKVPVYVDNDANCFAIGELYFGHGYQINHMVGLILGTGAAAGIIVQGRLYHGHNCGAGEFGMLPYLDHNYEHYCSGNFFKAYYQSSGQELFQNALKQEPRALQAFNIFGTHLGKLMEAILYTQDPEMIVLGGSVSKAYQWFQETMWASLDSFVYRKTVSRLQLKVSDNPHIALLGAAALYHEFGGKP